MIPTGAEVWRTVDWLALVGVIAFVLGGVAALMELAGDYFARRHP